jgi:amino acid transporter
MENQERQAQAQPPPTARATPEPQVTQPGHYKQELARTIGILSAIGLTLSGTAPLNSIFLVAKDIFDAQGSGVFLSAVIAAVLSVGMACCYAELGSAFPVAGGEYAVVGRVLGRPLGFVTFTAFLVMAIAGTGAFGLGTGFFLEDLLGGNFNAHLMGAVAILAPMAIAMLPIKSNGLVTGIFLALQLATILVITLLGFVHLHQPLSILIQPQTFSQGYGAPVSLGVILVGVTLALVIFSGYNAPMYFSEEVVNPGRTVPRAIFWSLGLIVVASVLPLLAILLGTPSLRALTTAENPMTYVLQAWGGQTVADLVVLSVVLSMLNANLAGILGMARIFYSSGRDKAWPGPISAWMAYYHPRWKTPIGATAFIGITGALIAAFIDMDEVIGFAAFLLVVLFGLVALSALVSRFTQRDLQRPHRMPLWPLPPLLALLGCLAVASQQSLTNIAIVGAILVLGGLYYALYLRPRAATHWVMLQPVASDQDEHLTARPAADLL